MSRDVPFHVINSSPNSSFHSTFNFFLPVYANYSPVHFDDIPQIFQNYNTPDIHSSNDHSSTSHCDE